jgi:hypothetical protein
MIFDLEAEKVMDRIQRRFVVCGYQQLCASLAPQHVERHKGSVSARDVSPIDEAPDQHRSVKSGNA